MNDGSRTVVAVCVRYYLPGFKSGGPVRTISNLVEQLGDEIEFRIVTSDRDATDPQPYPTVIRDAWQPVGKASVYYASPATQTLSGITSVLKSIDYDVLYLNSFFDSRFTILPLLARWLGRLSPRPVVVAPRGEFSRGAFAIRSWKKLPYRMVARRVGLYAGVIWHASSEYERDDIARVCGDAARRATRIAVNLPQRHAAAPAATWQPRQPDGPLRIIFLARIAPMKNLDYALRAIATVSTPVAFDIYGTVDDAGHWGRCQELIGRLPGHVRVSYRGAIPHERVAQTLSAYDLFFLPTQGENYGHAIAESLAQGTPVLISDRTPWKGLRDHGVGWDLPLVDSGLPFAQVIDSVAAMKTEDLAALRRRAADYGRSRLADPRAVEANRRLFRVS